LRLALSLCFFASGLGGSVGDLAQSRLLALGAFLLSVLLLDDFPLAMK
jgi:hypothetical protein